MKIKLLSIFALLAIISVESCKGPEGPVGPVGSTGTVGTAGANGTNGAIGTPGANGGNGKDGANGATGAAGATGAKGETGNANVVYNDWKPVKTDKVYSGKDAKGNYTYLQFYPSDTKEPLFTKEAMNTAAIYTYVKFNLIKYDDGTQTYSLQEKIKLLTDNGGQNSFLITGRNKDIYWNYSSTNLNNPEYSENYFYCSLNFNLTEINPAANYSSTPVPEYLGKTLTYFQDLVKTMPQYRHVVVYGSTKGRMASINWKDYDEVKRTLNLKN